MVMYGLVSLKGYGSDTNNIEVVSNNGTLIRNLIRCCGVMYIRSGIGLKCKRACQASIIIE